MINKGVVPIQMTADTQLAIRNYICGNIGNLAQLAVYISAAEGKLYTRQSAVNLVATVLPYWYKIGSIDLGEQAPNTVGEL